MIERELLAAIEPSGDQRGAARSLYGLFIALIDEGFDEDQALRLVGQLLTVVVSTSDNNNDD